jgi:phenylacetate-CoA ligase
MAGVIYDSRFALASAQLNQLRALLAAIVPANRFYQQKFASLGLDASISSLDDFSTRFPFTSKHELAEDQLAHPPYGTNLTFPLEQYTRCHQTSGTSGTPLRWLDTPASWSWMVENWKEVYRAAGVNRSDRVFFAFSFGPFIGFWLAFDAADEIGCLCLPGGGLSSVARLRAIIDHRATRVCCTPTYALRLAEVAAEEKIDLASAHVKTLFVAGEPGGSIPATRARLEDLWPGARVSDHHGMTEVGPVTYECPARPGVLHVMESAYFAEVIDSATGRASVEGIGELVLTTLGRTGSPLLRYRTGDLVKIAALPQASNLSAQPCACGCFNLALEGGILGRVDDMVVVRGVNVFPSAIEDILRRFVEIAEYQVQIVKAGTLAELKIQVEPTNEAGQAEGLAARLEKALFNAFTLRVPVTVVKAGTLPRFDLKAKRWLKN